MGHFNHSILLVSHKCSSRLEGATLIHQIPWCLLCLPLAATICFGTADLWTASRHTVIFPSDSTEKGKHINYSSLGGCLPARNGIFFCACYFFFKDAVELLPICLLQNRQCWIYTILEGLANITSGKKTFSAQGTCGLHALGDSGKVLCSVFTHILHHFTLLEQLFCRIPENSWTPSKGHVLLLPTNMASPQDCITLSVHESCKAQRHWTAMTAQMYMKIMSLYIQAMSTTHGLDFLPVLIIHLCPFPSVPPLPT